MSKRIPRGLFSPDRDGLLDPERFTARERATVGVDRLVQEQDRRTSPSAVVRRLQAAVDKALGGGRR